MSPAPLDFYFEFASTYSYPAAARIAELARQRGVTVRYRPFLLGPIFSAQGLSDSPFNLYPDKGRYMWRDLERITAELDLPFRRPSVFPRNGLLSARVALVAVDEGFADRFVPAVYSANFARDEDIGDARVIQALLTSLGHDSVAILEKATSIQNKERLRRQTDEARQLGIFGAPSFIVGSELFWGNDRLETALDWACRRGARAGGSCGFPDDF